MSRHISGVFLQRQVIKHITNIFGKDTFICYEGSTQKAKFESVLGDAKEIIVSTVMIRTVREW